MWKYFSRLRHLQFLFIATLAVTSPYAVPALWHNALFDIPVHHFLENPLESQQWYVIFGSATILLTFAVGFGISRNENSNTIKVSTAVFLWFTYTIVRAFYLPPAEFPLAAILLNSAFCITFLTAALSNPATTHLHRYALLLCLSAIPLALIAIGQKFGFSPLNYHGQIPGTSELASGKLLIASTFGHPNYMGSYLAPVFVLALGLFSQKSTTVKCLATMACLLILISLVLGGTRGSLLSLTAGTVAYLHLNGSLKKLRFPKLTLITGTVICSTLILLTLGDRIFASKEIAARAFYWITGVQMWKSNLLFGVGPAQFDSQFWRQIIQIPETSPNGPWYFALTSIIRGVRPVHIHNDHLQILVETGLVGASLWSLIWASILRKFSAIASNATRAIQSINASYFSALIAAVVDACFNFPFHLSCSGILIWSLIGLWAGWNPSEKLIKSSRLL